MLKVKKFSNGVEVINCTPHPCTFMDGDEVVEVPASGILINAKPVEEIVKEGIATFVSTKFVADEESEAKLAEIEKWLPGVIVVGSIIAAQAFPGRVVAMCPAPGFERVPPAEKRMRTDKFTIF